MFGTRKKSDPGAHRVFRYGAVEVHVENPEPLALAYDDIPGDEAWARAFVAGLGAFGRDTSTELGPLTEQPRIDIRADSPAGPQTEQAISFVSVPEGQMDDVRAFVRRAIALSEAAPLFVTNSDLEKSLGQYAAVVLAKHSVEDALLALRWYATIDPYHEVEHSDVFYQAIAAHGWTDETIAMWVYRISPLGGPEGVDDLFEAPDGVTIADWLAEAPTRERLLHGFLAQAAVNSVEWSAGADASTALARRVSGVSDAFERFAKANWDRYGVDPAGPLAGARVVADERLTALSAAGAEPPSYVDAVSALLRD